MHSRSALPHIVILAAFLLAFIQVCLAAAIPSHSFAKHAARQVGSSSISQSSSSLSATGTSTSTSVSSAIARASPSSVNSSASVSASISAPSSSSVQLPSSSSILPVSSTSSFVSSSASTTSLTSSTSTSVSSASSTSISSSSTASSLSSSSTVATTTEERQPKVDPTAQAQPANNDEPITQIVTNTLTSTAFAQPPTASAAPSVSGAASKPFWENTAAVAGVFTVVGVIAIGLIVLAGFAFRKRQQNRLEEDFFERFPEASRSSPVSPGPSMTDLHSQKPMSVYESSGAMAPHLGFAGTAYARAQQQGPGQQYQYGVEQYVPAAHARPQRQNQQGIDGQQRGSGYQRSEDSFYGPSINDH